MCFVSCDQALILSRVWLGLSPLANRQPQHLVLAPLRSPQVHPALCADVWDKTLYTRQE
jgi:hypothetical protein